ncbi:hypothetical protein AG1IA_02011 [Rhizoctonia solani AG-1 IA]|uniref:Uncharacterized protein n=1 Tax=Thanatephorus cucumeris (strain AG1-IA) TaxID=983506 RepID=L8X149_THACA|nr:hypothetical protein AG1IA_02011 [Rhizoctonia solani AG-1 IA]
MVVDSWTGVVEIVVVGVVGVGVCVGVGDGVGVCVGVGVGVGVCVCVCVCVVVVAGAEAVVGIVLLSEPEVVITGVDVRDVPVSVGGEEIDSCDEVCVSDTAEEGPEVVDTVDTVERDTSSVEDVVGNVGIEVVDGKALVISLCVVVTELAGWGKWLEGLMLMFAHLLLSVSLVSLVSSGVMSVLPRRWMKGPVSFERVCQTHEAWWSLRRFAIEWWVVAPV